MSELNYYPLSQGYIPVIYSAFEIPRKPKMKSIGIGRLNGNFVIRGFTQPRSRAACADYRLEFRIFFPGVIDSRSHDLTIKARIERTSSLRFTHPGHTSGIQYVERRHQK